MILAALISLSSMNAHAHHSFAAEFDVNRPVELKGVVSQVEWINPHAWIHLTAVDPGKPPVKWMVEAGTPNTLLRKGIDRNSLQVGMQITVKGFQSKDHSCDPECKANGRTITFADGKKLFIGSSHTGAPHDGADPEEASRKSDPTSGQGRQKPKQK